MTTETLSIGEQVLLDHYLASNAANRAGMTPESAREHDQRWGDIATEPRGVDYIETEAAGVPALWLLPAHIAKRAGVRALVLDHRQLPGHPHPRPPTTPRPRTAGC